MCHRTIKLRRDPWPAGDEFFVVFLFGLMGVGATFAWRSYDDGRRRWSGLGSVAQWTGLRVNGELPAIGRQTHRQPRVRAERLLDDLARVSPMHGARSSSHRQTGT